MLELINGLSDENYIPSADKIYEKLKSELLFSGVIDLIRQEDDPERREDIKNKKNKLDLNIEILDETLEEFTSEVRDINLTYEKSLKYDISTSLIKYHDNILDFNEKRDVSNTLAVIDYFKNNTNVDLHIYSRLHQIISGIVNENISQSHRSRAGETGELVMDIILDSAGLKDGKDYRRQFKSGKGSDTDVVFPYVEDHKVMDVQIFCAIQFSTNDRARLSFSELKTGGQKYVFTCNGMRASSKTFKNVSNPIIETFKNDVVKFVGYRPAINEELERLKGNKNQSRIDYFKNYTLSISEFAKEIRDRYT